MNIMEKYARLAPRYKGAAALVCLGMNPAQIAKTLGVSHNVAKNYLREVYFQLDARGSLDLAMKLMNRGGGEEVIGQCTS